MVATLPTRILVILLTHLLSQRASLPSQHFPVCRSSRLPVSHLIAMAAVTMAASSLVAFVAAPTAAATTSSFSRFSSVRMAPVRATRRLAIVAMAQPEKTSSVEEAIAQAKKACEDDPVSQPCAVAWDEVEEIAAEAAHQRDRKKNSSDPLEAYCADNPETDECRVYED